MGETEKGGNGEKKSSEKRNWLMTKKVIAVFVGVASIVCVCLFLFRSVDHDRPPFGQFTIVYRWGKPTFLKIDLNRDGSFDYIDLLPGYFRNHTEPVETWIDRDFDEDFECHITWGENGKPDRIELKNRGDGRLSVLEGPSAQETWDEIRASLRAMNPVASDSEG